jgi:hypothetical protein
LSDHKQPEESFRVIDRRPFTAEGELRKEVVEQEEREAQREAAVRPPAPPAAATSNELDTPPEPPVDAPKRAPAFENLIRMIGSNAAMVLGAYNDPRTGQPMLDPDAARELIDMLDALREKTQGNLAPEEDNLLLDLLGKLKMTYLEVNQALAARPSPSRQKRKHARNVCKRQAPTLNANPESEPFGHESSLPTRPVRGARLFRRRRSSAIRRCGCPARVLVQAANREQFVRFGSRCESIQLK